MANPCCFGNVRVRFAGGRALELSIDTFGISWSVATGGGKIDNYNELRVPLEGAGPLAADYLWGSRFQFPPCSPLLSSVPSGICSKKTTVLDYLTVRYC
jgi:hypothetical protein